MYMHDKTRPTVTNTYYHGSVFFLYWILNCTAGLRYLCSKGEHPKLFRGQYFQVLDIIMYGRLVTSVLSRVIKTTVKLQI